MHARAAAPPCSQPVLQERTKLELSGLAVGVWGLPLPAHPLPVVSCQPLQRLSAVSAYEGNAGEERIVLSPGVVGRGGLA